MDFHKEDDDITRSSRSQMLLKIGVLKKFAIFTGKRMCGSLSLIKLLGFSPASLFKRDSQTIASLCAHCENFKNTFFLQNTSGGCFFISLLLLIVMRQQFFNSTFSFGRNITFTFSLTYFSIYYLYSYFLTITRL